MAYNTEIQKTDTQMQRDYLKNRVTNVRYDLRENLAQMFNIYVNQSPKSYKDLIDWIKNDKYTLDTKLTERIDNLIAADTYYGCFFDGINWTGSGKPVDFDGHSAALDEMEKAFTATMDIIVTGDAAAGLKALQDFEAFVPSNAPKKHKH